MDAWIDLRHSIGNLARSGTPVFLTDNAVGAAEEESLMHLSSNLGRELGSGHIVPILTCKHPLDYCLMFARRAASLGFPALTVLGGDTSVGPPRCVPHAHILRRMIRDEVSGLALGGWANPHRNPTEQVDFIARGDFEAEFFLTQVVSHHSLAAVSGFLEELRRRAPDVPGAFGVFYYRSANPRTLERLGEFFPVPAREITAEFDAGASAMEICARSIRALRAAGAENVYVSNLGTRNVHRTLRELQLAVHSLEP
jgi:hypothetical protein